MVYVGHDCYRDRPAVLVMLAAAESVQAYWQDWMSVAVPVAEVSVEHSDVGPEECSRPREAVAGNC